MKKSILKLIVGFIIYFAPFIPLYFFVPSHKGLDNDTFPAWVETYMWCLAVFLFYCWAKVSMKINDWLFDF